MSNFVIQNLTDFQVKSILKLSHLMDELGRGYEYLTSDLQDEFEKAQIREIQLNNDERIEIFFFDREGGVQTNRMFGILLDSELNYHRIYAIFSHIYYDEFEPFDDGDEEITVRADSYVGQLINVFFNLFSELVKVDSEEKEKEFSRKLSILESKLTINPSTFFEV